MNQITVTGMVLSAAPVGEYDRRVVILTKERGKLAAFARGARKPNSALVGVTGPFSFGEFTVYEGRTSYTLASASISNYFSELRSDVEGACYGFYFLELAGYYGKEAGDERQLLGLLYQTMRAPLSPRIPNRLVRYVYELKVIALNGEGPQVSRCVRCGLEASEARFSVKRGGLVCAECMEGAADAVALLTSTVYTLQYIVSSPVEKLYTFAVTEEVLLELGETVTAYRMEYGGRHFKALQILETIV